MKVRTIILPAAGLLGLALLLWRQFSMEDEIALLRAELQAIPQAVAAAPATPVFLPATANSGSASDQDAIGNLESRIAELESVSNDVARIVNNALDEKEAREAARAKVSWGAAQATGAPDTSTAGDQTSAWAPASQDGGEEWLEVTYNEPIDVAQILVRETYNPGSISKVSIILENGTEVPIWQGTQQTVTGPIDRIFPTPGGLTAQKAKVYLDTARVPGWNEIDAVGFIDRSGARHWASKANASSSYGGNGYQTTILRSTDGGNLNLFSPLSR